MSKSLVVILAGSKADESHFQKIAEAVKSFGIEVVVRIGSAHKTAEHALQILQKYEADPRAKVYITVAGRSNALSGFVDGAVTSPVIACPPSSDAFGGVDIFSSLRMPSGISPAVILEPQNAGFLAARILALSDPGVLEKVKLFQEKQRQQILNDDKGLNN